MAILDDFHPHIACYMSIRTGDWNLCIASIKTMATRFVLSGAVNYIWWVMRHLADITIYPPEIKERLDALSRPSVTVNVTTQKSSCTRAESQEILEMMIDMYAKLDSEVDEAGVIEEEGPSTKKFLQTTAGLLRTLGGKLVNKIEHITFPSRRKRVTEDQNEKEMNSMRDDIIDFKQYTCSRFDELHRDRSSLSSFH